MFEFFIALFGGMYYGGKILSEKTDKKVLNAKRSTYDSIRHSIINFDGIKKLEMEFRVNRLEILNELSDELKYILGDNYLDLYGKYKFRDSVNNELDRKYHLDSLPSIFGQGRIENIWNLAFMVYLAKNGLALYDSLRTKYYIDGLFTENRQRLLNEQECREQRMVAIRLGKVIERYLSKKYPGDTARLFFTTMPLDGECLQFGYRLDCISIEHRNPLSSYSDI